MYSSMLPFGIKDSDLKPEIEMKAAHASIAKEMVGFFGQVLKKEEANYETTEDLSRPMIDGLELESSYP